MGDGARLDRALLAGILVAILAIVWTTNPLPMSDAPSHIATGFLTAELLDGDPFFEQHFELDLAPMPYWLTTLGLLLTRDLLGPYDGFRLLVTLYALALPLGFLLLVRRTPEGSTILVPVVALAVFNWAYWLGESNFLFGQALIAPAVALFRDLSRVRSGGFLAFAILGIVAYLAHVFVICAILGAIGLLMILGMLRTHRFPDLRPSPARWAALGWMLALFAVACWYIFVRPDSSSLEGTLAYELHPLRLGNVLEEPLTSPSLPSPWAAGGLIALVAATFLATRRAGIRERGARALGDGFDAPWLVIGVAFALLSYLGPQRIDLPDGSSNEYIAPRFTMSAFLFLLAAVRFPASGGPRWVLTAGIAAFAILRLTDAATLHREHESKLAEFRREVLPRIDEESRVLPVNLGKDRDPRRTTYFTLYSGNFAVLERRAYVATIYAAPGQQPLRHRHRDGAHRNVFDREITPDELAFYDYVLAQSPTGKSLPPPGVDSEPIARGADLALYDLRETR